MLEIVLSDRNVGRALVLSRWLGLRSRGVWFVARWSPGLWDCCRWLSINLLGDLFNVISGGEPRPIIGIPIGLLILGYLNDAQGEIVVQQAARSQLRPDCHVKSVGLLRLLGLL